MAKTDLVEGESTIAGFFAWMNERHAIWQRRTEGLDAPWTQDEIMLEYKFTNVFRELDRGTLALKKMIRPYCQELEFYVKQFRDGGPLRLEEIFKLKENITFNIMWYRLYNLDLHATLLGWQTDPEVINAYMQKRAARGEKVFTSAHLCTGRPGEAKVDSYYDAVCDARKDASVVVEACASDSMETVYKTLKQFHLVGGFIAYEIVCDLRFTPVFDHLPRDRREWANIGPGADRGMRRLGLESSVRTMEALYAAAHGKQYFRDWMNEMPEIGMDLSAPPEPVAIAPTKWYRRFSDYPPKSQTILMDAVYKQGVRLNPGLFNAPCPFELREIEHCLCEFDKYERVRLGQGRPRQKFRPTTKEE